MQRIKQQVDQLQQQLAGLTLGQKLLTAALVATMLLTVVWWVHRATTDQSVALFEEPVPAERARDIRKVLANGGIPSEVQADQVYVAREMFEDAIQLLAREQMVPASTTSSLGKAISGSSILEPSGNMALREKDALQSDLAQQIREWDGVKSASVTLNIVQRRQIGQSSPSTAAVNIVTAHGAEVNGIAEAASKLVAGAAPGMKPEGVGVVINGRAIQQPDGLTREAHQFLDVQSRAERHFADKVREVMGSVPVLAVTVAVEMKQAPHRSPIMEPPEEVGAPQQALAELQGLMGGRASTHDMGVMSMEPRRVAREKALPAPGLIQVPPQWAQMQQDTYPEAGQPRPVGCVLTIPRSWLVQQWQAWHSTEARPEPVELQEFETVETEKLKQRISKILGGLPLQDILVAVDADPSAATGGGANAPALGVTGEESAGISLLIRNYGKEVAIGVLATVSLLLVCTMLKKNTLAASVGASSFEAGAMGLFGALGGRSSFADDVDDTEAEELLAQAGQMLEQVQSLVKENPDIAASLVQRWLSVN